MTRSDQVCDPARILSDADSFARSEKDAPPLPRADTESGIPALFRHDRSGGIRPEVHIAEATACYQRLPAGSLKIMLPPLDSDEPIRLPLLSR